MLHPCGIILILEKKLRAIFISRWSKTATSKMCSCIIFCWEQLSFFIWILSKVKEEATTASYFLSRSLQWTWRCACFWTQTPRPLPSKRSDFVSFWLTFNVTCWQTCSSFFVTRAHTSVYRSAALIQTNGEEKCSERQLSFPPQFSIARIVRSSICLQQQNKPLFSSDVCFSPQPDPITSRRHLLLINTKSQINERERELCSRESRGGCCSVGSHQF